MSNPPIPKPRTQIQCDGQKKPIPLPRTKIRNTENSQPVEQEKNNSQTDMFWNFTADMAEKIQEKKKSVVESSRNFTDEITSKVQNRKKSVLETSKYIKGQISGRVQEKKNLVMESTRNASQSVRSLVAKKFGSLSREGNVAEPEVDEKTHSLPATSEIFQSIQFQSPLTLESKKKHEKMAAIYNNDLNEDDDDDFEPPSFPPPSQPPPPPPDESLYDEPHSTTSGSSGCDTISSISLSERLRYEEIFPDSTSLLSYTQSRDSDSDSDKTYANRETVDIRNLHRSDSWSFYDSVSRTGTSEPIYGNIDIVEDVKSEDNAVNNVDNNFNNSKIDNQRLSEISSISIQNSLYENHILQPQSLTPNVKEEVVEKKIRESVLTQFDPLSGINNVQSEGANDLSILESILQGDAYGTIGLTEDDHWMHSDDESESGEILNPPTPPTRFDSLPVEENATSKQTSPKSNWFVPIEGESTTPIEDTKLQDKSKCLRQRLSDVLKLVPDSAKNISRLGSFRTKDESKPIIVRRPTLNTSSVVQHRGGLLKIGRNGSVDDFFGDVNFRWCVLGEGKLTTYTDKTQKVLKETIPLESIISIQVLSEYKTNLTVTKSEEENLYSFELCTVGKNSRSRHVFGCRNPSDRRIWMQRILEATTTILPSRVACDYIRAGWAFIKEGAGGEWKGAWLLLRDRQLVYCEDGANNTLQEVDLRKARCIVLQEPEINTVKTGDTGPQLLVDVAGEGALYIRCWMTRSSRGWRHVIRSTAHDNGAALDQQQLTNDNIPVIVDKCINFVYAHGCMSEGIYRRSGSSTTVAALLNEFRRDAWAVQLTTNRCTEHDVACVLKRFMRELPEPLLTSKLHAYFCKVAVMKTRDEKVSMYKCLLEQLPLITQRTVRKLMTHLHFIQSQGERNLMTVANLAAVWGPTLMHTEGSDGMQWSKCESSVIADLISTRTQLWPSSAEELVRERTMLAVLERYHQSGNSNAAKPPVSGDLRVWIHLNTPNSGQCVHIGIGPQKTAEEVCRELCSKMNKPAHLLQLEESILDGQLMRPLHYKEKVLDVVLRWGYWDEADRKNNCIVLRDNDLYREIVAEASKPLAMSGELKYADEKSKTFRNFMFEFSQAKLSYYKDKNCSIKLGEWRIEDILWYIGHEAKRDPHSRWCITFISRSQQIKRSRGTPWFGHAIAGTERTQQLKWLAAMALGEHPQGLLPSPVHVDLIES